MGEIRLEELSEDEFDILKELSNIGTGNAATAISKMLDGKVDINIPVIKFLNFNELSDELGGAEKEVIGILVTLEKDVDGMMMFVIDKKSASVVINGILSGNQDVTKEPDQDFSEMDYSVLTDFGNIISGSYLSAIATLTGLVISPSVPALAKDMAGAVLSVPATEFGKVGDKVLLIQSVFYSSGHRAEGFFILVPTLDTCEKMLRKLRF